MPAPLKRTDKRGWLFTRPPEIEACIAALELLDTSVRETRFEGFSRKHPQYVPSEAVLHFLRRAWRESDNAQFAKLFKILIRRVETSLRGAIPDASMANAADIRDEVLGRFVTKLTRDCKADTGVLDFFEVRFNRAMMAVRITVLRRMGPARLGVRTEPLGSQEGEGPEISPEVEAALEAFLCGEPHKFDDPAFRLTLFGAIDRLPQDQREVIYLQLQGIPTEADDPTAMTISRMLKCDPRTVRNRKARAHKALKALFEAEAQA